MISIAIRSFVRPPGVANPVSPIVLAQSAAAVSCPADTNEDILATITVPGGSMGANGMLRITSLWTYTNSANNKTLKARLGGIGGTAYMSSVMTTTATVQAMAMIRNRNAANSQVGGWSNNAATGPFEAVSSAVITSAIDTAADQTLVLTGQKASAGETLTLEAYLVELLYGA